jgi:hypothetical protein
MKLASSVKLAAQFGESGTRVLERKGQRFFVSSEFVDVVRGVPRLKAGAEVIGTLEGKVHVRVGDHDHWFPGEFLADA